MWLTMILPGELFGPVFGWWWYPTKQGNMSHIWVKFEVIVHFTVVCLVAWPLNESEAGVDLVLMETSLLFVCKVPLISTRTASLT